jgi:hypothetical protein
LELLEKFLLLFHGPIIISLIILILLVIKVQYNRLLFPFVTITAFEPFLPAFAHNDTIYCNLTDLASWARIAKLV